MGVIRTHNQNKLKPGSSNGICDICGFKFKREDLRKRWDDAVVCRKHWESKHPSLTYNYKSRDEGAGGKSFGRTDSDTETGGTDVGGNTFPPPVAITTLTIDNPAVGQAYLQLIETDIAPNSIGTTWEISAGTIQSDLSLAVSEQDSSQAYISGTPTGNGTYNFTVKVTTSDGRTDTQAYEISIGQGAPASWSVDATIPNQASNTVPGPYFVDKTFFSLTGKVPQMGGASPTATGHILDYNGTKTWAAMASLTGNTYAAKSTCINRSSDGKDYIVNYLRGGGTNYYDVAGNSWTSIGGQGYVDNGSMFSTDNGRYVWYVGGTINATALNTTRMLRLDTTTWSWSTSSAVLPKDLAGLFSIELSNGKVLIGGGLEGSATPTVATLNTTCWLFDPSDLSFTVTDSLPAGYFSYNYCFRLTNGDAWIGGAINSSGTIINKSWVWDANDETWSAGVNLPANCAAYPTASADYSIWLLPDGNLMFKRLDGLGSVYTSSI